MNSKENSPESEKLSPVMNMEWNYALGGSAGHCLFKSKPEDFFVDEELPFEPEGEGEHLYVHIEKRGENTDWVAGELARHAGIKRQSVSYAGRKDRQGVTRQWFCVTLPGMADPDWQGLAGENLKILKQVRHLKKLRTGTLKGNAFKITLRDVDADKERLEALLQQVAKGGVPNYYGSQRFGFHGRNLTKAMELFKGKFRANRNKRSIYLSAARSWLFNEILSERVGRNDWHSYLQGDVLGFCDSNSLIFEPDDNIQERIDSGDVSPTVALWGRGRLPVSADALELEEKIASPLPGLRDGLENAGLKQERRVTRIIPRNMSWEWLDSKTLVMGFHLPKGCFATSVLRELLECREVFTHDTTDIK